jgi:hypothetical protein
MCLLCWILLLAYTFCAQGAWLNVRLPAILIRFFGFDEQSIICIEARCGNDLPAQQWKRRGRFVRLVPAGRVP